MQVRVRWLGQLSSTGAAEVGAVYEMSEAAIGVMKQTRQITLRGQMHQVARWRPMSTSEHQDVLELDIEVPPTGAPTNGSTDS